MNKKKIFIISLCVITAIFISTIGVYAESSCNHSYANGQCEICGEYYYPIPDDSMSDKIIFEISSGIVQCISYQKGTTLVYKIYEDGQSKLSLSLGGLTAYRYAWINGNWSAPETISFDVKIPYISIIYETADLPESHEHSYTSTITRNATCSLNGIRKYTCSCGYYYEESIARLSHNYTTSIIEPTCVSEGYTNYVCTSCGYTFKTNVLDALGHIYKNGWCMRCDIPEFPDIDVTKYTSILNDLGNDNKFTLANYPAVSGKYELDLFQIAESKDGELFLYVYNPSAADVSLEAKYINMSLQHYENRNQTFRLYSLTKLSSEGTITKYLVNNFKVSSNEERYYNIAAIYTPYNSSIHDPVNADDDIINYKGLPISTFFQANTDGNTVKYRANKVSYVDVDIKDVGYVRMPDGYGIFYEPKIDAHFVAFSVENFDVTKIHSVDVHYLSQSYHHFMHGPLDPWHEEYGALIPIDKRIPSGKKYLATDYGIFGIPFIYTKYEWESIYTLDQFRTFLEDVNNETLSEFDDTKLGEAEFVICIDTTSYTNIVDVNNSYYDNLKTNINEVSLLRMHFSDPFGTYNLGVVSDIVSDDGNPDFIVTPDDSMENIGEEIDKFFRGEGDGYEYFEMIIFIIVAIVVIALFVYLIPKIKKLVCAAVNAVSTAVETVVNIIGIPFKFIKKQRNKVANYYKSKKKKKRK